jgi:hypothetical protein
VTGRQGIRRRKLLDDLKERRGYSHLKEEALDRSVWRAGFGRGFGPVVRQTAKRMDVHKRNVHYRIHKSPSTSPHHEPDQISPLPRPISCKSVLILSSQARLSSKCSLSLCLSDLSIKILYASVLSPILPITCHIRN